MKKKQIIIRECADKFNAYIITFENARCLNNFRFIIEQLIKTFLTDETVFFGFYRTDGMNLSAKRERELRSEIPEFFRKNGDIQKINPHLTVARIYSLKEIYDVIVDILDYHLSTVILKPKKEWEAFGKYHSEFLNHGISDIINDSYADVLLFYSDSGDLSVCFNRDLYNPSKTVNQIKSLIRIDT